MDMMKVMREERREKREERREKREERREKREERREKREERREEKRQYDIRSIFTYYLLRNWHYFVDKMVLSDYNIAD